jgi:hypothetical protein
LLDVVPFVDTEVHDAPRTIEAEVAAATALDTPRKRLANPVRRRQLHRRRSHEQRRCGMVVDVVGSAVSGFTAHEQQRCESGEREDGRRR